ncbi:putative phage abortive infection protein [Flavobacterium pectinovorum]|uniref:putative phage abortive infection protein n=2 Tax=Flavobacterium TaxID=237 RepID=UPI0026602D7C|nr:putative phage abortive infection protein [Flavobacterium pectinovorum]WKL50458.1 putative phage abortive infection protein [Flavobacterium pectinovorum]
MSTYNILLTCILIIFVFLLLSMLSFKSIIDNYFKRVNKNYIITPLIVISVILIIVSFLSPYYFTKKEIGDTLVFNASTGWTGDTLGGIMNPFIALAGAVLTFIAFYIQKIANDDIKNQFKIQQFESQFYEMLHLHRENLNEMTIEGYVFEYNNNDKSKEAKKDSKEEKITSGKKVFVTMLKEFESIHLICTKVFMFRFNLLQSPQKEQVDFLLKQFIFDHSYYVFFNGINLYKKNIERYEQKDITGFLNLVLNDFIKELESKRRKHLELGIKEFHLYYNTGSALSNSFKAKSLWLSFNYKPFSGHQSILAHYYRHLFQTVKFVAKQNENLITYESKRDYLRVLRSMMSNQEQILLLYNWYGGFGSNWEEKASNNRKNKKGNYFFTDYRMIHNIPPDLLINEINLREIFNDNYRSFLYEKDRKGEDTLFELIDDIYNKEE